MQGQVVARFLVDRPIRPGMVRAILDTLSAQGGVYEPQLVRRSKDEALRRISGVRPAGLLDEVGEGGTQTTFLRVSEARPHPLLSFAVSPTPRTRPTSVALTVPAAALASSEEIDRLLGICKGLYLFLEATWGVVGIDDTRGRSRAADARGGVDARGQTRYASAASAGQRPQHLGWANFFGPEIILRLGPARLLASAVFIAEILPDGGMMLVTHPAPEIAVTTQGRASAAQMEEDLGLETVLRPLLGRARFDERALTT